MKKKRLPLKIALGVVILVLAVLGGFSLSVYIRAREYYACAERAFAVPGIWDGVVGQGLCRDGETGLMLVSGYMKDGSASRIYLVDRTGKEPLRYAVLADENGAPLPTHCAAIAVNGPWLYVTGQKECCLYVFGRQQVLDAASGEAVRCAGRFDPAVFAREALQTDILCIHDGKLLVGEFYDGKNYNNDASHHMTTAAGDRLHACCLVFPLREETPFGIGETPEALWAIPDCVQGVEIAEGKAWLSVSWGADMSHALTYDISAMVRQEDRLWGGETLPCYALDSACLLRDTVLPPMSEQMAVLDGKLYTMSECASMKYFFGWLFGGQWVWAADTQALLR